MKYWGVERRQHARIKPPNEYRVPLHGSITARLLDFSESGVLLASKVEMSEGDRVELSAIVRSSSVRVPVEIRHVSLQMLPRIGPRFCAGAVIADPSPEQRGQLDAVLRAERT